MCLWSLLHCFYTPSPLSLIPANIHTQPRSVLLPSIHLPLISQLINTLKICCIISRGRLLPCTGSKATLWLSDQICAVSSQRREPECNCETHYQYIFLMESQTTWEVTVWCKNKYFYTMDVVHSDDQVMVSLNMTYTTYCSFCFSLVK